eukprot:RCo045488
MRSPSWPPMLEPCLSSPRSLPLWPLSFPMVNEPHVQLVLAKVLNCFPSSKLLDVGRGNKSFRSKLEHSNLRTSPRHGQFIPPPHQSSPLAASDASSVDAFAHPLGPLDGDVKQDARKTACGESSESDSSDPGTGTVQQLPAFVEAPQQHLLSSSRVGHSLGESPPSQAAACIVLVCLQT